ncbi:unnamed protein product [Effrenium voratum]|nr:unnamed protein product [Effrenium voratum]
MDEYSTYRRCVLRSKGLAGSYWATTVLLVFYVIYTAIISKNHLLLEVLNAEGVLFARLKEGPEAPSCAGLAAGGSTGLCVELPWLSACELSASRGFLSTYVQEALFEGRPSLQRLGSEPTDDAKHRKVREQAFYIGQPESWVLVLEHRVACLVGTWSGQDLEGFMRKEQLDINYGHPIEYVARGLPPASARRSFAGSSSERRVQVQMADLLSAANMSLDDECHRCAEFNVTGERARLRRIGVELDVTLFYSNLWFSWSDISTWFGPNKEVSFELKVSARQPIEGVRTIRSVAPSASFFPPEEYRDKDFPSVTRRSYGVRMLFHQQGVIGKWDFPSFLFFLLQGCTFLGVAWTLTELLCTFLPMAHALLGKPAPLWLDTLQKAATSSEDAKKVSTKKKD